MKTFNTVVNTTSDVVGNVASVASKTVGNVASAASKTVGTVLSTTSDVVDNVFDATSRTVGNVYSTTSDFVGRASSTFDSAVNNTSDFIVNREIGGINVGSILIPIIGLFLILYVPYVRPNLPKSVERLFENPFFRFAMYAYIVYRATYDPTTALVVSAAYIVVIMIINKQKVDEMAEKNKQRIAQ
jgi:hypothetical protein